MRHRVPGRLPALGAIVLTRTAHLTWARGPPTEPVRPLPGDPAATRCAPRTSAVGFHGSGRALRTRRWFRAASNAAEAAGFSKRPSAIGLFCSAIRPPEQLADLRWPRHKLIVGQRSGRPSPRAGTSCGSVAVLGPQQVTEFGNHARPAHGAAPSVGELANVDGPRHVRAAVAQEECLGVR